MLALSATVFGYAPGALSMRAAVHQTPSVSMAIAAEGSAVPDVTFQTRVRVESTEDNPFDWKDIKSSEYFKGKRCVVFALPGAFTPTCSSTHLPGYESKYAEMKALGIDEVYCLSVNDAFVSDRRGITTPSLPIWSGVRSREVFLRSYQKAECSNPSCASAPVGPCAGAHRGQDPRCQRLHEREGARALFTGAPSSRDTRLPRAHSHRNGLIRPRLGIECEGGLALFTGGETRSARAPTLFIVMGFD